MAEGVFARFEQSEPFAALQTLDDVREYVSEGYRALGAKGRLARALREARNEPPPRFEFEPGRLPLGLAEPGPLMERAVQVAGGDGITMRQLRDDVFAPLGAERFDQGLSQMRGVRKEREKRPNRAGRMQEQVVFYPGGTC